jgi:hypothetical protein
VLWLVPVIPATLEVKIGRMAKSETSSEPTSWEWWLKPMIPVTQEAIDRTTVVIGLSHHSQLVGSSL